MTSKESALKPSEILDLKVVQFIKNDAEKLTIAQGKFILNLFSEKALYVLLNTVLFHLYVLMVL